MTFDGQDNLWILASKGVAAGTDYALYRINAPLPTTSVANVTVDTIIAKTTLAGSNVSFTGIAFNSSGHLYLSTGSGAGASNNLLYEMTSAAAPLTLIGTLPNGYGDDLTSCVFPAGVLPLKWLSFQASFKTKVIELDWKVAEDDNVSHYEVEYKNDLDSWRTLNSIPKKDGADKVETYQYLDAGFSPGNNYYRIAQVSLNGKVSYSPLREINAGNGQSITIGPNPSSNTIVFHNLAMNMTYHFEIFDNSSRLVYRSTLRPGQESVDISALNKGFYLVRVFSDGTLPSTTYKIVKQ
jgi:Secretion system C-terminal sorting domain